MNHCIPQITRCVLHGAIYAKFGQLFATYFMIETTYAVQTRFVRETCYSIRVQGKNNFAEVTGNEKEDMVWVVLNLCLLAVLCNHRKHDGNELCQYNQWFPGDIDQQAGGGR